MLCCTLVSCICSVVLLLSWWHNPWQLHIFCLWHVPQFIYSLQLKAIAKMVGVSVLCVHWWHDGPPPELPPYVPKWHRKWKRLIHQHCQLLKSWIHTLTALLIWTKISASDKFIKLHLKLQGAIFDLQNKRKLHIRKLLATKHNPAPLPRVKFRKHSHVFPLLCLTSLVVSPAGAHPANGVHDGVQVKAAFDTDSLDFGANNHWSACISNVKEHFVGDLVQTNKVIKGYGGTRVHNVWQGTMKLSVEDDTGQVETFTIPNSYYAPDVDARLLLPQHWRNTFHKVLSIP